MRFRKSIKICRGVKLNLSKSGPSLTVGQKGLSFNVGGKGAYMNWSIPGTGVYDRVRLDTLVREHAGGLLDGLLGGGEEAAKPHAPRAAGGAKAGRAEGPSVEELAALEQEMAMLRVHELAPDVGALQPGRFQPQQAEAAMEAWLSEAEAPVPFAVQTEMAPEKDAVFIDLDLPEIEDMPGRKLVQLADGTLKIKAKTQKEQREDYRTCVLGLGEYVAANVLNLVPQARRVVVSAYTRRRDGKTGEAFDAFIYSILFEREAFTGDYQRREPCEFCGAQTGRFYVLASGLMKAIAPYEAEDL